ncbi:CTP synthase [bacterium]|nr:CTP synthase [bacterium]
MKRFIFITGGVVSSLGKGIASAALGALLQARGYRVRLRKLDPYLNVDPGTMSPTQHGEVYVTDDGAETDLDLGHYERFTGVAARRSDNTTTGRIYQSIIERERKGDFLGATLQVIPHVTDAIKSFVLNETDDVDFVLCEIGGTVGDIEGLPFFEAIRQLGQELGRRQTIFIHLTLLPYLTSAGEMKTKPTQHSVKELRSIGIQPDILLCRSEHPIPPEERRKIALFCNVRPEAVIEALDAKHIYEVPLEYGSRGLDREVLRHFEIESDRPPQMDRWTSVSERLRAPDGSVTVAVVGKYVALHDAYKSVIEALSHGGLANRVKVNLKWVQSDTLDRADCDASALDDIDAVLLPGGFGERGALGKMRAAQHARRLKLPCFGICYGMQLSVVELARNLAGVSGAGTTEFGDPEVPVVSLMSEWMRGNEREMRQQGGDLGGTMRLGAYPAVLKPGSRVASIYGTETISERHRHRYEVTPSAVELLSPLGVVFSGMSPDGRLPEIFELEDHPWFIGVQFHPELKSRPFEPHPLFTSFIAAAIEQSRLV